MLTEVEAIMGVDGFEGDIMDIGIIQDVASLS